MSEQWVELKRQSNLSAARGDLPRAAILLQDAIALATNANPMDLALMQNKLASIYLHLGDYKLAEATARQCIGIELEFGDCGEETTNMADYYVMLAKILERQNHFQEALKWSEKGVAIFCKLLGSEDDYVKGIIEYQRFLRENAWKG